MYNKEHKDLSGVEPDYRLDATELYAEFEADEATANEKYLEKILEVSGDVNAIEYGNDSTLSVTLMPPNAFAGVICAFDNVENRDKLDIAQGDYVTIRGKCSGMLMDVLLNNCVLIE